MRSIWTRVRGGEEARKADQIQSQVQDSGEKGGGEGTTVAQPADQVAVTAEQNNITEPSSAEAEVKPEETTVQQEVEESKPAELSAETAPGAGEVIQNNGNDKGDWQQREQELLKKIEQLEKFKNERTEDGVKLELKVREEEIDLLKARVRNLETELQAALSKPSGKNHEMIENIKQQHEELLSKARGMIFDKTKMVKNQELQIEALTTQVQSLKDINLITKDLLEIRNSEVKAMEDRLKAMEARFQVEKERYGLVLQRAQTSTTLNDDLKKEYETQLAIFKELRGKYEQRVQALVAENTKLKEIADIKGGTSG
ncbi:hypothetical protein PYW08_015708 [Mythimna loreyi]|uniref:Uncharacterized protein n=1 Tax=Mythimna loreyi TaxID=667449 RepID=A0ACC2QRH2_9NEOP|nr:hypothetical protein PYW08_015708 [Mythimna loreyi]